MTNAEEGAAAIAEAARLRQLILDLFVVMERREAVYIEELHKLREHLLRAITRAD